MFNRANKMTALLVAAAAVVSLVPATGVNAAEMKRIDSKDGTVYDAVAYKDGKAYIDGVIKDNEAAYYYENGKFTDKEDVSTNAEVISYGEKYAEVENGDYFVDLTNGKVEKDVREDAEDDAASTLRKKIKDDTDDRYLESDAEKIKPLTELSGNKFGETWYSTTVESATKAKTGTDKVNGANEFNIFTDAKGNYIDADYNLGKIRVESTTGDSVNVENTNEDYNIGKVHDAITAQVANTKVLTQDAKNIYRRATVTITAKPEVEIAEIYGKEVKTHSDVFTIEGNKISFEVIQKITKEQHSGDVDGAKYAKDVTNYVICKDNADALKSGEVFSNTLDTLDEVSFTTVGGKLVAYKFDKDGNEVKTQTISLKTKQGLYYTDVADESSEDVETYAVDVDVDGNLWRLDGGYLYKWNNDEDWDKQYKVDGAMNELSVYDKDNIVLWNEKDELYSIIDSKEDKKEEDKKEEVKAGWNQAADGTWSFVKADGTKATAWLQDGANWYFLNDAGVMQTGWVNAGGAWYYTNGAGAMQTGWVNAGGAWYYCNGTGAMQTGWINDNGTWYFCDASGKMLANTTVNGYVLGANGAWVK